MYSTTHEGAFPDDELRHLLKLLVRAGGLLEPHDYGGLRVSLSEVFALGELAEGGTLSQGELATRLSLEKSTVSRLAAGMERRGWLSRERDPANRRFYRLRLTPDGWAVVEQVGADLRTKHAELFASLTADERAGLILGLAGLARALKGGD
ncbi:MarR family transcriptional regulator [Streptosporangium sp. NBC_01755]|uniref:MarR family winged helix-turn-helix transcriptional regulator n=1 Tax=Streptosporangium sp. NBC_01755 TaxID=2975949 RepID=UPI002DDA7247|nr:MarR family transcriptional regulator [Streptosporangium sp. NBC_01755]WSD03702.1 MarR family transcriptional regulator [Streptosporangium sp. NBC_01755]